MTIACTTKRASLQYNTQPASVNVTRTKGQANIQTQPAQVHIDSTATRESAGILTSSALTREFANKGAQAAAEATRAHAEYGNSILDSYGKGDPIIDNATRHISGHVPQYGLGFIPSVRPQITVDPGFISFDYTMDRLTFDWNVNQKPQLEYVPGNVEFEVTQYNEVIIEYVGDPIYVPPSGDPNYVAPKVDATA